MDVVLWPAWGFFLSAVAIVGTYLHPLVAPAFLIFAPYAAKEPRIPVPMAIMAAAIVAYLLLPPPAHVTVIFAAQVLPRVATAVLLWVARPAANTDLPEISSLGAIGAIATGFVIAWQVEWGGLLFAVVSLLVMRAALILSYRAWGGIQRESLGWVRQAGEILILLIGHSRVGSL